MNNQKVLLTGITGFLGSHTAIQLLNKGYLVTGTLRDKNRINSIREIIGQHTPNVHNLTIEVADLDDSKVWKKLVQNMDFIQHIASPFPRVLPKHENELILPAKNGTLNILKAASEAKVKRVVMVSSLAAVIYGKSKKDRNNVFNEADWTDETNKQDTAPYLRSKTIAEKAAWEYLEQNNTGLELTTVLPGAILGPVLEKDFGTSANIVISILNGSLPATPKIGFDIIDVRSVAELLILAMEMPQSAGKRYIASAGYLSFAQIAKILKQQYPGRKISTRELPNCATRIFSLYEKNLKPILLDLGIKRKTYIYKAINELNWQPRPVNEAIISCAQSVIQNKIVR